MSNGNPESCVLPHPSASVGEARLLLVEDNLINQKVATLMLKHMGYRADIANNGSEAVALLERNTYDLVLMDCLMPEMDGLEATRVIRSRGDHGAKVPIIAMTANAFAEDRQACLAAGMSDYIAKPVREAELSAKLKRWLTRAE
jgi:CheY-like chemotaxis protein